MAGPRPGGNLADSPDRLSRAVVAPPAPGRCQRKREETARGGGLAARGTRPPNWGEGQGVRVLIYDVPDDPIKQPWPVEIAEETLHTIHNLQLVDVDGDRRDEIVLACWEGVFLLDRDETGKWIRTKPGSGNQQSAPNKGAAR